MGAQLTLPPELSPTAAEHLFCEEKPGEQIQLRLLNCKWPQPINPDTVEGQSEGSTLSTWRHKLGGEKRNKDRLEEKKF